MEVLGRDKREGLGRKAHPQVLLMLLTLVSGVMLLSSLYAAEASVFRKARESVIDASAPVLAVFAGPIALVQDVVGHVGEYFGALEQNKALREENAELRQWMHEALELRKTLAAYEALGVYRAPPEAKPIDAFVIGESNDAFSHSMIVNAGRAQGVREDLAVVDERGLVGRIVEAGDMAARVLLLSDPQSRVPVYIEGAEVDALLVGRSTRRPVIDVTEIGGVGALAPGQRVLTSGAGGALPRGIAVGEIRAVTPDTAIVDLYANYARTRLVRVINFEFPGLGDPSAVDPGVDAGGTIDGAAPVEGASSPAVSDVPAPSAAEG